MKNPDINRKLSMFYNAKPLFEYLDKPKSLNFSTCLFLIARFLRRLIANLRPSSHINISVNSVIKLQT